MPTEEHDNCDGLLVAVRAELSRIEARTREHGANPHDYQILAGIYLVLLSLAKPTDKTPPGCS